MRTELVFANDSEVESERGCSKPLIRCRKSLGARPRQSSTSQPWRIPSELQFNHSIIGQFKNETDAAFAEWTSCTLLRSLPSSCDCVLVAAGLLTSWYRPELPLVVPVSCRAAILRRLRKVLPPQWARKDRKDRIKQQLPLL